MIRARERRGLEPRFLHEMRSKREGNHLKAAAASRQLDGRLVKSSVGLGCVKTWSLAAVSNRSKAALLDYFVGEGEHIWRDSQTKCFGGLEIDKQLELGQLYDR